MASALNTSGHCILISPGVITGIQILIVLLLLLYSHPCLASRWTKLCWDAGNCRVDLYYVFHIKMLWYTDNWSINPSSSHRMAGGKSERLWQVHEGSTLSAGTPVKALWVILMPQDNSQRQQQLPRQRGFAELGFALGVPSRGRQSPTLPHWSLTDEWSIPDAWTNNFSSSKPGRNQSRLRQLQHFEVCPSPSEVIHVKKACDRAGAGDAPACLTNQPVLQIQSKPSGPGPLGLFIFPNPVSEKERDVCVTSVNSQDHI